MRMLVRYSVCIVASIVTFVVLSNNVSDESTSTRRSATNGQSEFPRGDMSLSDLKLDSIDANGMLNIPAPESVDSDMPMYLFPIFRYGTGPNNQYRSLKVAILFAIHFKRTLVLGPFFNHFLVKRETRHFNETFDVATLSTLLPVVSIEQFYHDCNGDVARIVHGRPFINKPTDYEHYEDKYRKTRRRLNFTTGISLPGVGTIPKFDYGSAQKYINASKSNCLGFYTPLTIDYEFVNMTSPLTIDEYYKIGKQIDEHMVRATPIQRMADEFKSVICNGASYIALHWRVNDDFMKTWCPTIKSKECKLFHELNQTGSFIGEQIQKAMTRVNVGCIYLAAPPDSWDLITHLRGLGITVYTPRQTIMDSGNKKLLFLYEDNYILSLIEQELALRSVLFIGSSCSSWTSFVKRERQLRNQRTTYLSELFGFPETSC